MNFWASEGAYPFPKSALSKYQDTVVSPASSNASDDENASLVKTPKVLNQSQLSKIETVSQTTHIDESTVDNNDLELTVVDVDNSSFKKREIRCRNIRKGEIEPPKSTSPVDVKRESKERKEIFSWSDYKIPRRTRKLSFGFQDKKKINSHEFKKYFNFESNTIIDYKVRTKEGQISWTPFAFLRQTAAEPHLFYSPNPIAAPPGSLSRKQLYTLIPDERKAILEKLKNLPTRNRPCSVITLRKWYPKNWKKLDQGDCKLNETSVGLSFLRNYEGEDDDEDSAEEAPDAVFNDTLSEGEIRTPVGSPKVKTPATSPNTPNDRSTTPVLIVEDKSVNVDVERGTPPPVKEEEAAKKKVSKSPGSPSKEEIIEEVNSPPLNVPEKSPGKRKVRKRSEDEGKRHTKKHTFKVKKTKEKVKKSKNKPSPGGGKRSSKKKDRKRKKKTSKSKDIRKKKSRRHRSSSSDLDIEKIKGSPTVQKKLFEGYEDDMKYFAERLEAERKLKGKTKFKMTTNIILDDLTIPDEEAQAEATVKVDLLKMNEEYLREQKKKVLISEKDIKVENDVEEEVSTPKMKVEVAEPDFGYLMYASAWDTDEDVHSSEINREVDIPLDIDFSSKKMGIIDINSLQYEETPLIPPEAIKKEKDLEVEHESTFAASTPKSSPITEPVTVQNTSNSNTSDILQNEYEEFMKSVEEPLLETKAKDESSAKDLLKTDGSATEDKQQPDEAAAHPFSSVSLANTSITEAVPPLSKIEAYNAPFIIKETLEGIDPPLQLNLPPVLPQLPPLEKISFSKLTLPSTKKLLDNSQLNLDESDDDNSYLLDNSLEDYKDYPDNVSAIPVLVTKSDFVDVRPPARQETSRKSPRRHQRRDSPKRRSPKRRSPPRNWIRPARRSSESPRRRRYRSPSPKFRKRRSPVRNRNKTARREHEILRELVRTSRSPERVPLDVRISQVLVSDHSQQYENVYQEEFPSTSRNEVKVPQSTFRQVGNMLQIVPADDCLDDGSLLNLRDLTPAEQPVMDHNVDLNHEEPRSRILQVGNMLQIVPTEMIPTDHISIKTEISTDNVENETLSHSIPQQSNHKAEYKEQRREEKEKRRKEKEETKMRLRTENSIKRALQRELEENDDLERDKMNIEFESSNLRLSDRSILMNSQRRALSQLQLRRKSKVVQFADGVRPGEGTSPSAGEEFIPGSPPPPKRKLKHKRTKKRKSKLFKKMPKEVSDSDDDLPPPSPPPGSPPPHIFPPRIKVNPLPAGFAPSIISALHAVQPQIA